MGGAYSYRSFSTFEEAVNWVIKDRKEALEKANLHLDFVSIEKRLNQQKFDVFIRYTK